MSIEQGFASVSGASWRRKPAAPVPLGTIPPLLITFDLVWITTLGFVSGATYSILALGILGDPGTYLGSGLAAAALYTALAQAAGLYRPASLSRPGRLLGRAIALWVTVFVCLASIAFLLKIGALFSRGAILTFFGAGLVGIVASRVLEARIHAYVVASRAIAPRRVLVVGVPDELQSNSLLSDLRDHGYAVAGAFSVPYATDANAYDEFVRILRDVVRHGRDTDVEEVILALPWDRPDMIRTAETELRVLPISVKLVPGAAMTPMLERPLQTLGPTVAVELQRPPLNAAQRMIKRAIDQCLAGLGLLVLLPFFAVIAAAIRFESPGPALFLQSRAGFNGRPFRIFKFRTMSTLDDGAVVVQARKNDSRVTRLGALLRRSSIDELPQLINVLRGDMSLVGPRPHALAHDTEYDRLIATYAIRHKMKPGITGWAQVNGYRGETPELGLMERRVENDLWYIDYWSIWLDIRILFLTVVRLRKSPNAY